MSKIAVIGISGESIFMKLDNLPTPSVTSHAKNCHIEPGGKGYNQAVACKKFNSDVTYLTKVGNDNYGLYCKDYMDKLQINNNFIIDSNWRNGCYNCGNFISYVIGKKDRFI